MTRIVLLSDAKQYAREVSDKEGIAKKLNQQIVLDVIPLQHVNAVQLISVLQPLMPTSGLISAYNPSNAIVISGTAELIARMRALIHSLDSQSGTDLEEIKLKHATAKNIVKLLQELQKSDTSEGKVNTVSYVADDQTNSILVSGSQANLKQAKARIEKLDESSSKVNSGLTVIHLQYVSAATIVPILAKLAGGNVTSTNGSAASSASSGIGQSLLGALAGGANNNQTSGSDMSSGLSGMSGMSSMGGAGGMQIGADTSSIFQAPQVISGGGKDFSLVAVPSTNNIIVSAPAQMVSKLKKIVKILDVPEVFIVRINQTFIKGGNIINGKESQVQDLQHLSIGAVLQAINNDGNSD